MKTKLLATLVLAATLGLGGAARAATDCGSCEHEKAAVQVAQSGHESAAGHDMSGMGGAHGGTKIREAKVDGYALAYYLIAVKEMPGMKMPTHHLMTYVTAPDGRRIADAKVGYLVNAAGLAEQKAMAMAMDGGYGADVDLTAAGPDKVTVKIVAGAKTLLDEFTYPVPKQK